MSNYQITSDGSYVDEVFKKVDIRNGELSFAEFTDCQFIGCNFSQVSLQNCRFMDCTFQDCTLKLANVDGTTFSSVQFVQCDLIGVDWTKASWSDWATKLNALSFDTCDLKYSIFFGLELKKLRMKNCIAHEVNFAETDLEGATFTGTDFKDAVFLRTNLTKADFVGAENYTLSVTDNKTKGARFALPEAIRLLYSLDITVVDTIE